MGGADPLGAESVSLLQAQREQIVAAWLQAVREEPFHRARPEWAVADHIPRLLDAMLAQLGGADAEQDEQDATLAHAVARAEQGLDSGDVVTEFRLLRRELQRALGAGPQIGRETLLQVELRLHDELDRIVTLALRAFDAQARSRAAGLETVAKLAHEIAMLRPLQDTLTLVCERACALLDVDRAVVALGRGRHLEVRASAGRSAAPEHLPLVGGVHGRAYASAQPAMTGAEDLHTATPPAPNELMEGMSSVLAVPLGNNSQVVGTLGVAARRERAWAGSEVALLSALAAQTSVALENAHLFETLQQRERLLDQVVDNAPALIAVTHGPDHQFGLVNPRFAALAHGRASTGQLAVPNFAAIRGFDPRPLLDRARLGESITLEDVAIQPDAAEGSAGTRYFTFSFLPLAGAYEGEAGVLLVGYETTEAVAQRTRIETLAGLAATRANTLTTVIGAIPDGVVVCDAHGTIVSVNEGGLALLGLQRDAIGQHISALAGAVDMRTPEGRPLTAEEQPIKRALQGEVLTGVEVLARRGDTGEDRLLRLSVAPILDANNTISGAVCLASDVTTQRQADRQRDEFISRASHELKTPLTSAKGLLQLTRRRLARGMTDQAEAWIESAEHQIDKLAVLVEDLRSVSQLRLGGLRLRLEEVSLLALVRESVLGLQTTTSSHQLLIEATDDPLTVMGDRTRLSQVLDNVLSNAIKYSPDGGNVTVRCYAADGQAVVEVRDSGIGVPAAERTELFRPFYRATNADDASTGMGLGLYISYEIARQHQGSLSLIESGPEGSTFRLSIPLR